MFGPMTLYEFIQADEMEQIETFWDGVLVGTCIKDSFTWECRQVNDFYIEYRKDEIGRHHVEMKCHKKTVLIKPV